MPEPRRITNRIVATGFRSSQGVTKNDVLAVPMRPKNSRIGLQEETPDENVLTSHSSLFCDDEDSSRFARQLNFGANYSLAHDSVGNALGTRNPGQNSIEN